MHQKKVGIIIHRVDMVRKGPLNTPTRFRFRFRFLFPFAHVGAYALIRESSLQVGVWQESTGRPMCAWASVVIEASAKRIWV